MVMTEAQAQAGAIDMGALLEDLQQTSEAKKKALTDLEHANEDVALSEEAFIDGVNHNMEIVLGNVAEDFNRKVVELSQDEGLDSTQITDAMGELCHDLFVDCLSTKKIASLVIPKSVSTDAGDFAPGLASVYSGVEPNKVGKISLGDVNETGKLFSGLKLNNASQVQMIVSDL